MVTADKIMTSDVISISPNTGILEVVRLLAKHRVSGLPVIDGDDRKLVGIITEKDVLKLLVEDDPTKSTVADYMTRSVTSFKGSDSIVDICNFFLKSHIRRVPIVDQHNRLLGLISRRDLINEIRRLKTF